MMVWYGKSVTSSAQFVTWICDQDKPSYPPK